MTAQQAVHNSSATPVIEAAQALKAKGFPLGRWLVRGNRYSRKTIQNLKREGNRAPVKPQKLAEYIAASVVLHCADGWTFFSHAIDNLLSGDKATSVFMGYYAQLRAVMSFMASEGIGIFNDNHYWFDSHGNCHSFRGSTHGVVRDLIIKWANFPSKSVRLLSILSLENKSFAEWVNAAHLPLGSPAVTELARDWLSAWSIDLNILNQDHSIRNEASYRPQRIHPFPQLDELEEYIPLIVHAWRASEPYGSNRFNLLDRYLLKNTLRSAFRNRTGKEPRGNRYSTFVQTAIGNLGLSINSTLFDFLSSPETITNHPILMEARKKGENEDGSIRTLPILSRAYLLLRIASAATQDFLSTCSIVKDDLRFWWEALGNDAGLWIPGNLPDQMTDLWADVKDSVDSVEDWYTLNTGMFCTLKVRQDLPFDSWQVNQFTRAGLWAIGL